MREGTRGSTGKSSELLWETLEKTIRGKVQEFIQEILEEEVTDFLGGRRKSQRKSSAEGDFELALRGLLGDGAPLSKSTVRRLREKWIAEHAEWECRSLAGREIVYAWADGIYVKAGLEKDKAALPVIIGAMADGTKEVLAVASGFRESAESWAGVLRGLRARGLGVPKLLVADGNLGIRAAARQVWPEAGEQRCWNHKMVNVLDRLPKREQKRAKALLREVVYAESGAAAEAAREPLRGPLRRRLPQGCRDPGGRLGPDDRVGRAADRRPHLDPAFIVDTPPALPQNSWASTNLNLT